MVPSCMSFQVIAKKVWNIHAGPKEAIIEINLQFSSVFTHSPFLVEEFYNK
jgi:hypothetical protein